MLDLIPLFLIVFTGSFITGLSGFGGGSIVLAGMMFIYPPDIALPLHSLTQVFANGNRILFFFRQISWKIVFFYSLLMFPASWFGGYIFDLMNPHVLKMLVGFFIIISLLPIKFRFIKEPKMTTFTILGAVSGFLGVFVGAIGPLVTPFFNQIKTTREGNLSTKSAGQFILQIAKLSAFTGLTGFSFSSSSISLPVIIISSILGMFASHLISKKMSDEIFEKIINFLLFLSGSKIFIEGFVGLKF